MADDDYLCVLAAIKDLPFNCGRKLLVDYLRGDESNKTITKHQLKTLPSFGKLYLHTFEEVETLIQMLMTIKFILSVPIPGKGWMVLEITDKGREELAHPKGLQIDQEEGEPITDEDKKLFSQLNFVFPHFDERQKKAVICESAYIQCIAGAGSGKTSVLAKRIQFLVQFKGVDSKDILAVTFTRKARREMQSRLAGLDCQVRVETFNSFCEQELLARERETGSTIIRVVGFGDKMRIFLHAIKDQGLTSEQAIGDYFPGGLANGQTRDDAMREMMIDCFAIRDSYQNAVKELTNPAEKVIPKYRRGVQMMQQCCKFIDGELKKLGLRDYSDQMINALKMWERLNPPKFSHILVDEFQDVNPLQYKLLQKLNPKNLFCVGDPRQSIFGWRGSQVNLIQEFCADHPDAKTIYLVNNYRSSEDIVKVANASIKPMQLPDMTMTINQAAEINLRSFGSADMELSFIANQIKLSKIPASEIFVLARTNAQLKKMAEKLKAVGIRSTIQSEDMQDSGSLMLSTVHTIKGMEARMVYLIGAGAQFFPCRATDQPIRDALIESTYDSFEEERRLIYVALTRAKEKLHISYSGRASIFITDYMRALMKEEHDDIRGKGSGLLSELRDWRRSIAESRGLEPFYILPNQALIAIAAKKPSSQEELLRIKGVGPVKVSKYGDQIIDLVSYFS